MNEIYRFDWQSSKDKDTITITKNFFEHLLNCLANQKFIGELPPNADALSLGKTEYENIQIENQNIINDAWSKGMFILCLDSKMEQTYKNMFVKYCEIWNKSLPYINSEIINDAKKYPNDDNVVFKWRQLVPQEIEMWIQLCCFSNSNIDIKNEKYEHGMVSKDDFEFICSRRGFTFAMKNFLICILVEIGIIESFSKSYKKIEKLQN